MPVSFEPGFIQRFVEFDCTEFRSFRNFRNYTDASVCKLVFVSNLYFLCTLYHSVPAGAITDRIKEHEFLFTTACCFYSIATAAPYAAVIENHEGSRSNKINKIFHFVMFNLSCRFVKEHKFVVSAFTAWTLRNQFFR